MTPTGKIHGMLLVKNLPKDTETYLRAVSTFPNPAYEAAARYSPWGKVADSIPAKICLIERIGDYLCIPRGFDVETLLPKKHERVFNRVRWRDKRVEFNVKFPELHIEPGHEQRKLLKAFRAAIRNNTRPFGTFLLVAPTSVGKTILQILCARQTRQRTLVICHTNLIRDAWYADLYKCLGIAKKDVGLIQQAKFVIGKQFTLASTATLDKRMSRWPEIFSKFGCVVVDEAHKMEPRLVRFIKSCPCKFIIGATATPEPSENTIDYLPFLFGPPVKRLISTVRDTKSSMSLRTVELVNTDFRYDYDRDNLDQADLSMALATDEDRNKLIIDNAVADWEEGHSVLIACKRSAHVRLLHDMLIERGVEDANMLFGETNSQKRYTEVLIKAILTRKVRMVVSTIPAIKLGANLNPLDRMHLVSVPNKRDTEQLIGRIRRRAAGKTDTVLKYYVDRKVPYLHARYLRNALPVFRKLKIKGFENVYVA